MFWNNDKQDKTLYVIETLRKDNEGSNGFFSIIVVIQSSYYIFQLAE